MTFQIFIAPPPLGNDSNDGVTPNSPVYSLVRANLLCHDHVPDHNQDIEVIIAPGLYLGQTVSWDYYSPVHSVTIIGTDHGLPTTAQGIPEFRGQNDGLLLTLPSTRFGERTNIEIRGLFITHYRSAIIAKGSSGNLISGCYFRRIGQQTDGDPPAYGTILLENANYNQIKNCYFRINGNFYSEDENEWRLFHGVYLAHHSNENIIEGNNFSRLSGHPIKVRNSSNYNEVKRNRFFNVKSGTALQDYYMSPQKKEAPSFGNIFSNNEVLPNGNINLTGVEIWRRVFDCPESSRNPSAYRIQIEDNYGNPQANNTIFR